MSGIELHNKGKVIHKRKITFAIRKWQHSALTQASIRNRESINIVALNTILERKDYGLENYPVFEGFKKDKIMLWADDEIIDMLRADHAKTGESLAGYLTRLLFGDKADAGRKKQTYSRRKRSTSTT